MCSQIFVGLSSVTLRYIASNLPSLTSFVYTLLSIVPQANTPDRLQFSIWNVVFSSLAVLLNGIGVMSILYLYFSRRAHMMMFLSVCRFSSSSPTSSSSSSPPLHRKKVPERNKKVFVLALLLHCLLLYGIIYFLAATCSLFSQLSIPVDIEAATVLRNLENGLTYLTVSILFPCLCCLTLLWFRVAVVWYNDIEMKDEWKSCVNTVLITLAAIGFLLGVTGAIFTSIPNSVNYRQQLVTILFLIIVPLIVLDLFAYILFTCSIGIFVTFILKYDDSEMVLNYDRNRFNESSENIVGDTTSSNINFNISSNSGGSYNIAPGYSLDSRRRMSYNQRNNNKHGMMRRIAIGIVSLFFSFLLLLLGVILLVIHLLQPTWVPYWIMVIPSKSIPHFFITMIFVVILLPYKIHCCDCCYHFRKKSSKSYEHYVLVPIDVPNTLDSDSNDSSTNSPHEQTERPPFNEIHSNYTSPHVNNTNGDIVLQAAEAIHRTASQITIHLSEEKVSQESYEPMFQDNNNNNNNNNNSSSSSSNGNANNSNNT